MPATAIVTLIATAIAVAAIAIYLIAIGLILRRVFDRLESILPGVSAVTEKTAPAGEVIAAINADLAAGAEALQGAVERLRERNEALADDDDDAIVPGRRGRLLP